MACLEIKLVHLIKNWLKNKKTSNCSPEYVYLNWEFKQPALKTENILQSTETQNPQNLPGMSKFVNIHAWLDSQDDDDTYNSPSDSQDQDDDDDDATYNKPSDNKSDYSDGEYPPYASVYVTHNLPAISTKVSFQPCSSLCLVEDILSDQSYYRQQVMEQARGNYRTQ